MTTKKTKIVKTIAKEIGLKVKTLKLSKVHHNDLIGLPSIKKDEWIKFDPKVKMKVGQKIQAIIRHCNPKLNLDDEIVNLKIAEDGYYIDNGPDELSYNWDIIKWKPISKKKK